MRYTPAIESEKTVLGGLLLDSGLFWQIKDKLCPEDFFLQFHQTVYQSMIEVYAIRESFDAAMIADHTGININHLVELSNECCSLANLSAHADIIREKSVQRQLIECSNELREEKETPKG